MNASRYSLFLFLLISCQNTEPKNPWPELSYKKRQEQQKGKYQQVTKNDSTFLTYISENIITHPDEKIYISDITQLKSIQLINCDSSKIHYKDKVDGKEIELKLSLKKFEKKNHKIQSENREKFSPEGFRFIDGKEPWGGYYGGPSSETNKLQIWVNGNEIKMEEEFTDIYNLMMCDLDKQWINFNPNPSLKYDEKNKVFYLYVHGGNAAGTYFGKFIFDENKFIKRYLLDYGDLSPTGSFRKNFKGF
jgi:hypothetical protein